MRVNVPVWLAIKRQPPTQYGAKLIFKTIQMVLERHQVSSASSYTEECIFQKNFHATKTFPKISSAMITPV